MKNNKCKCKKRAITQITASVEDLLMYCTFSREGVSHQSSFPRARNNEKCILGGGELWRTNCGGSLHDETQSRDARLIDGTGHTNQIIL